MILRTLIGQTLLDIHDRFAREQAKLAAKSQTSGGEVRRQRNLGFPAALLKFQQLPARGRGLSVKSQASFSLGVRWHPKLVHANRMSGEGGEKLAHGRRAVLANMATPEFIGIHRHPRNFPKRIHISACWIKKPKIPNVPPSAH